MPYVEHAAGSATGEHYTTRELEALGLYSRYAHLRYKDLEAYLCLGCDTVYNVKCPKCGAHSSRTHHPDNKRVLDNEDIFMVERPIVSRRTDGYDWAPVQCRKCDFRFHVIIR